MVIRSWSCLLFALGAGLCAGAAMAAPLVITKTSSTISDPVGNVLPKAIPGAVVDYTIRITNPLANGLTPVNGLDFADAIPPNTILRVADLGLLSSGPIAFGAGTSTLSYVFTALSSVTDNLDFSSNGGATWGYLPIPDANGYDAAVTNVRVRMSGSQLAGSTVSLRFRVKLK